MIEEKLDQRIAQWLQAHQQEVLERWMALIRIPSVRAEAAPGAPFGRECDRAMRLAADYFSGLGMSVRIEAEHGYAVAELGEGEKTLGLYCHADVVPAGDGWLYTQPFEPLLRDGYLIGRGAGDNKNGIMAAWCIAAMVQQLQLPLKSRLRVVIGSNEESGMADMTAYAQAERMPELNLAPDSGFACSLGEKGILRLWAQCDTPLEAVESLEGGDAFNIVLDRVEAVLKPNGALAEALAARGAEALRVDADGTVRFTATGIAKHAASPDGGENATAKAAALLAACPGLPESDRRILQQVEKWLQGFFGEGLGIAHEDSRFGRLTAVNGMVTTKNGHLCIALDCRYGTEQDPKALEDRLQQIFDAAGWQITWLQNRPGFAADPQSPVPETLRAIADSLSGLQTRCYYMAGGTYSRCLKNAFAVGTSLALADQKPTGLQIPAGRGGAHQRDEAVRVENFFRGVRTLTHALLACDPGK